MLIIIVNIANNTLVNHSRNPLMYVCICNDVKEKQIKAAIASGIDTLDGLKDTLDVATCCGCCEPMVNDYLEEHHAKFDVLAYAV
ncbi:putative bacterioferritin-associated ferredoxin [Psychrobacter arcticus 273-4]|uniref:Bacterioferritin-associated ferredoxin n=2 Tax=Psychrobacter arcticus TaxID=334543 RepID=Q4FST0_PSYA2|nr:putative bacterioferritin-associated ferredoxin [Psychrobacter arcticus 273-4]